MSDQELLELIINSVTREDDPIDKKVISDNFFIKDPRNIEFINLYNSSDFRTNKWEWHQIARFALKKADAQQYMYDKLWSLLLRHRGHFHDYFELETKLGTFPIPNPLTELNRFESLYDKFFEIFRNITNRMHFDYPKKEYSGPYFQGNVDWQKTLQESETQFPTNFHSTIPYRKFDTPENILLTLCTKWMLDECNRILDLEFKEPLDEEKKNILITISKKTKHLILNFPFPDVIKSALKYWNLSYDDPRIFPFEAQTKKRIDEGLIHNNNYSKLLQWIDEFRNLNLWMVSEVTPIKNLLKSQVAQDTVYEAWIFFEFVDFFYEMGMLRTLHIDKYDKPYFFTFEYRGEILTFWYEKTFVHKDNSEYGWAVEHRPDFTIMLNNKIIGVFDAKNYSKGQDANDAIVKMLAYQSNLNTKFGVLFFPYLPEFWDDIDSKRKRQNLLPIYKNLHPSLNEVQIASVNKPESSMTWDELSPEFKKILPPDSVKPIVNPRDPNLRLFLMRLEPSESMHALDMKNQTMNAIFEEMKRQIPQVVQS